MKYLVFPDLHARYRSKQIAAEQGCGPTTTRWFYDHNLAPKSALYVSDEHSTLLSAAEQAALQSTLDWNTLFSRPAPDGPTGLGEPPDQPLDLDAALDGLSAGDTLTLQAGVYRVGTSLALRPAGMDADHKTTIQAAPGARVIVTATDGTFPTLTHSDHMHIKGLWFVGSRVTGDGLRRAVLMADDLHLEGCFYVGYTDSMNPGAHHPVHIDNCMCAFMGEGALYHGLYISGWETTPESHVSVTDTIYLIPRGGYAWLCYHQPSYAEIRRTLSIGFNLSGNYQTYAFEGSGHQLIDNILWDGGFSLYNNFIKNSTERGPRTIRHNLLGPNFAGGDLITVDRALGDTIEDNGFYNSQTFGATPQSLSHDELVIAIGITAQEMEAAAWALGQSFSQSIADIYADATIDANVAILRGVIATWAATGA